MKACSFLLCLCFSVQALTQNATQTVRGVITDKDSKATLPGATVLIYIDSNMIGGDVTDENGKFRMEEIPVGRIDVKVTYIGYGDQYMHSLILTAGKELILQIQMEENIADFEEVVVNAQKEKGEVINDMATVSVRQFSVEETDSTPAAEETLRVWQAILRVFRALMIHAMIS
ncbi:MAG: carboxypeptidase-like regulatory domain-containing protein [Chitinophagales bacterium]